MTMSFQTHFMQQLALFRPYFEQSVSLSAGCFRLKNGKVAQFVAEIEQTARNLEAAKQVSEAEYYAQLLILQFDALQRAVQAKPSKPQAEKFQSSYHFPKNIHFLSPNKRLAEYQKALRALNEKISWLIEQQYQAENADMARFEAQIAETEFRKNRCLAAIEQLEEEIARGRLGGS